MARTMTKGGSRIQSTLAALIIAAYSAPLAAQAGLGHLEDAATAPRGLLRLRAATVWTRYDSRFITGGIQALGASLTADSLGSNRLPALATLESQIESAARVPFSLSLGRSRLDATAREEIVPILFEYGLTSRLSLTAMLPVIRKRVAVQFQLDTSGGFVANVGPNPHRTSATSASNNAQVQSQFLAAQNALQQRLTQCAQNSSLPQCSSVNGREAAASALLAESQQFATFVGAVYGTSTTTGGVFVPMSGSAAQGAIALRVATFNTEYLDYLGETSDRLTAMPSAAGGPAGVADLQEYLTTELGRDSVVLREQVAVGDWELGAKFHAFDIPESETSRLALQAAVAGAIRFASGSSQSRSDIIDQRTSSGKIVLSSRGIVDARFARLGLLASADFAFGVKNVDTSNLATRDSRWTELHVAPRWHFSEPFAIYGAYSLRSADKTGGDQLLGGGFSFTTLSRWAGGSLPIEMRYTHLEAISGDAGRPRFFRDQIELRLYYRLLKR